MPPTTRENEIPADAAEARSGAVATNGDTKQQPVALEVPVTVNGARTIEGDKREPFSETTKTVLIFGNGAVIRLTSSVAPGQLLFLTNERTKKEVVCQVVKSKNYKNVSGYVELEFTEPVVGFWGMRFPADRIGPPPQAAPAATPPAAASSPTPARQVAGGGAPEPRPLVPPVPVPSKPAVLPSPSAEVSATRSSSIVPPAVDSSSLLSASKPKAEEFPLPIAAAPPTAKEPSNPAEFAPPSPNFNRRASDQPASILAPKTPGTVDLSSVAPFFEVRPGAPTPPPARQKNIANDSQSEELRQQTARLQDQLSHMEFTGSVPDERAPSAKRAQETSPPPRKDKQLQESIAHVLEVAKSSAPTAAEPVKAASETSGASVEEEELKIPAWLEPLARNASTPTSTQELLQREKARRLAEQIYTEESLTEPVAPEASEEQATAPEEEPVAAESTSEPGEEAEFVEQSGSEEEMDSGRSKKPLLIGAMAAVVTLAAFGGWWYLRQSGAAHAGTVPPVKALAAPPAPAITNPSSEAAGPSNVSAAEAPVTRPAPSRATPGNLNPGVVARGARTAQPAPAKGNAAAPANPQPSESAVAVPEDKKAGLGEVHLATPKVSQNRNAQGAEPDGGVSLEPGQPPQNGAETLGAGLSVSSKQPAAPAEPSALPVGGDVKQAKLLSSVAPIYPALAKNQHISGNVVMDALIDVNGRVTTMRVISGPTLLHQAAMDALRQWKYQPATLDGKAVPMHLTVTLQFRLQ